MNRQMLLMVSRRDLLEAGDGPDGAAMIRALARLTQMGYHFVATASQPDEWSKKNAVAKRGRPGPKRIRDRLAEAGGILDGVYYIPQSLLTQQTRREEALNDLLERYAISEKDCYLVSSNRKLLATAKKRGVAALKITGKQSLGDILKGLVRAA